MISTHILDIGKGTPASGVTVKLQKKESSSWSEVKTGVTNADGRFSFDCEIFKGTYQIIFETENYFKKESKEFFFINTPVAFKIEDATRKYHVPLLLSPFGYSTYRGS